MAPGRSEVALDFELNTHVSQLNFAGEYLFLTCEDINPREKNQNGTQENPENPQNGPQENPEKPSRRRKVNRQQKQADHGEEEAIKTD